MEVDEDPLTDSSQNTNTGALKGAGEPNYATADQPDSGDGFGGTSVGYYIFDGNDDYVNCGTDSSVELTTAIAIVSWVYLDASGDDGIMAKCSSADFGSKGYNFLVKSDNDISGVINNVTSTSTTNLTLDSWDHVAMVWSQNNTIDLYLNGVEVSYDSQGTETDAIINSSDSLYLGTYYNRSGRTIEGWLDEVALFDRTINSTEINDAMDNGLAAAVGGWTHDWNGVPNANIAEINGVPIANIAKVNGI